MTAIQAYYLLDVVYNHHENYSYEQIRDIMTDLEKLTVADLKAVAAQFGVCPLKPTKAAILKAVRDKIERRKSTAVRCSF